MRPGPARVCIPNDTTGDYLMKKVLIFIVCLVLACGAALGIMTMKYTQTKDYRSDYLAPGFFINDVRVFDMTYEDAVKAVTEEWNAEDVLVIGEMDEPLATFTDISCTYNIEDNVAHLKQRHKVLCAMNHYLNVPVNVHIPMTVATYSKKFKKEVTTAPFLERDAVTETQDAYVDLNDPSFPIIKEVYGSRPDTEKFFDDILTCIELGEQVFQYKDSNYTAVPKVKSDDPQLIAYQTFCRSFLHQKITYDLGEDSYTLTIEDLQSLMKKDLSGKASKKKVAKFVKKIAKRYDNVNKNRTFKSLTGKTITIDNSNYGWSVDQEGETEQLVKDINSHKDVSRQPVWATEGYGDYSLNIGDTYIDVDISKQTLVYFRDGKKMISYPVVTGCRNTGTTTPTGLFSILSKERNVTLKGRNANGSKYSSFVQYWMAFLGSSYGIHDASWRSEFGGDIWITNGSHGCINSPTDQVAKLFDMADWGTPVIVHY